MVMYEALLVTVKEVFLEPFFDDFHNFHKIRQYLHDHNSIGLV